jgi:hypothetical protein
MEGIRRLIIVYKIERIKEWMALEKVQWCGSGLERSITKPNACL